MGKRKGSVPQKVGEEKRKCLSWNMLDGESMSVGSVLIIPDNHPGLLHESSHQDVLLGIGVGEITVGDEKEQAKQMFSYVDHLFKLHLDYCSFYVSILDKPHIDSWSCEIGRFDIQLSCEPRCLALPQGSLPQCEECWLYVGEEGHNSMLYFELDNNEENCEINESEVEEKTRMFWFASVSLPIACLQALDVKTFQVVQGKFEPSCRVLEVIIYAKDLVLHLPKFPSEHVRPNKINQATAILMEHFYGFKPNFNLDGVHKTEKHDIDALYEAVKKHHEGREITVPVDVQHPCLKPVLRPYQRQAVCWMLNQERYNKGDNTTGAVVHPLYAEVLMKDGKVLYYNKHGGILVAKKPLVCEWPPGGLLADEMGLGKTVEVLSCMLLHPRSGYHRPYPPATAELPTFHLPKRELADSRGSDWAEQTADREEEIQTTDKPPDYNKYCSQVSAVEVKPTRQEDTLITASCGTVMASICTEYCSPGDDACKKPVSVVSDILVRDRAQSSLDTPQGKEIATSREASSSVLGSGSGLELEQSRDLLTMDVSETVVMDSEAVDSSSFQTCEQEDVLVEDYASAAMSHIPSPVPFLQNESAEVMKAEVKPPSLMEPVQHTSVTHVKACSQDGSNGKPQSVNASRNMSDIGDLALSDVHVSSQLTRASQTVSSAYSIDSVDRSHPSGCNVNIYTLTELQERKNDDLIVRKRKKKRLTCGKKKRNSLSVLGNSLSHATTGSNIAAGNKPSKMVRKQKFEVLVEEKDFRPATFFTDTAISQKQWFECVCGGDKNDKHSQRRKLTSVQCEVCGMWQHAQCLHYDLNNPHPGRYKCPHCHVSSPPVPSGATLIISPFSICHQWEEEIKKHVRQDALRVFIYTGVNKQGFIQPQTLADCDIVITTYETLRKEIDYVDLPHCNSSAGRRFRHRKRFMAIPSPIIAVEWWRICLDEAQMVECTTTKTAEMALRLSAVNRWCVTGTPIQKSVKDLYGLLLFLGMDPYWVEMWWTKLLYQPFCYGYTQPMYDTLSLALWRTAKKDVLNQILLPPQSQEIHWLTFSPVEDHFYRRQYRDCMKEASQRLNKWKDNSVQLKSMDRHTMSQLLHPLLRLRQACCHPQAVRGEFLSLNKNTMTMEELLESLTKKAKVESEECHRQLVAAFNGLAALHIIKEEYSEAVDAYRQVLLSVSEHGECLGTDDLQKLHALHNLHEILLLKPSNIHPTLRDHQLKEQAEELRQKYLLKAAGKVTAAQQALLPVQQAVQDAVAECNRGGEWWSDLLEVMIERELDTDLVQRIRDDIEALSSREAGSSMASSFCDVRGLEYCIYTQLSAIESSHGQLVKAVKKLSEKPGQDVVNQTVECCLRPVNETLGICPFCKTDELFNAYESKLFSFRDRGMLSVGDGEDVFHQVNTKRQGTWADSDVEKALKSILAFCRHHGVAHRYNELLDTGTAYIKMLDTRKKEFKCLRSVWLSAREQVSAVDELDMAATRLRVRLSDEPRPDTPQANVLEQGEVGTHRIKLVADKANAEADLKKKLGQLLYLTNLAKSKEGNNGDGSNPDPCPVCQKPLGVEWSVLLCGHCYCLDCMRIMVDKYSFGGCNRSMKCALCRQTTHHSDISYVSTKKGTAGQEEQDKIVGSHSTKVEAVVRCIKNIHNHDPTAKALVFSMWHDVLDVVGKALHQNGCANKALYTPGKFQQNLKAFKESETMCTLLIPLHSGANGLNLIEATHVLLVEPILNPAEELQAIGRVHRIGQTRPTHIHKFLVRGTIEQRIHNLVKSMSSSLMPYEGEEHTMTIGDLASLFTEVNTEETPTQQSSDSQTGRSEEIVVSGTGDNDMDPAVQECTLIHSPVPGPEACDENPFLGKRFFRTSTVLVHCSETGTSKDRLDSVANISGETILSEIGTTREPVCRRQSVLGSPVCEMATSRESHAAVTGFLEESTHTKSRISNISSALQDPDVNYFKKGLFPGSSCALQSPVPGANTKGESLVPGTITKGECPIPGTSTTGGSLIPWTSATGESLVPGTSTAGECPVPGTSTTGERPVPGTSTTGESPVPETNTMRESLGSGTSTTGDLESLVPETNTTGERPVPGTNTTGESPVPGTSTTGESPVPGTNTTGESLVPRTSTTGENPVPGTNTTGESPVPGTNTTGESPVPGTSTTGESPVPGTNTTGETLVPGTSTTGESPVYGTNTTGGSLVSGTNTTGESPVHGTNSTGGSLVSGTNTTGGSLVPGISTTGESLVHGTNTTGESPVHGTNATGESLVPETSTTGESLVHGTSTTGESPVHGTNTTGGNLVPGTNTAGESPVHGTNSTGGSLVPGTNITGESLLPGTSTTGESPVHGTNNTGGSQVSGTNTTGESLVPGTSTTGESLVYRTNTIGQSPIPGTSSTGEGLVPGHKHHHQR